MPHDEYADEGPEPCCGNAADQRRCHRCGQDYPKDQGMTLIPGHHACDACKHTFDQEGEVALYEYLIGAATEARSVAVHRQNKARQEEMSRRPIKLLASTDTKIKVYDTSCYLEELQQRADAQFPGLSIQVLPSNHNKFEVSCPCETADCIHSALLEWITAESENAAAATLPF